MSEGRAEGPARRTDEKITDALLVGKTPLSLEAKEVEGALVDLRGEPYYRVSNCDAVPPFLITLVSNSNHWLFVASNGALTAGRRSPDHALFPYTTDDRLYDSVETAGPKTVLRVGRQGATSLWEPFSERYRGLYAFSRSLCKSVFGNKIVFEEVNDDLGLAFSYEWLLSDRFGLVRRATLASVGEEPVSVEVLDGLQNLMPYGIDHRFQMEFSTLADAYKQADLEPETGLGLIRLAAIPVDRAEPSEALRATTVWALGLDRATRLLSTAQLDRFRRSGEVNEEHELRGRRGAYFVSARLDLAPGEKRSWYLVADVDRDASDVSRLRTLLREDDDLERAIEEDVERGTRELTRVVASADGLQASEDELGDWRHYSNALFNVMRGGVPDRDYSISSPDLASTVARVNREVASRHSAFLGSLPDPIGHSELLARVRKRDDPDLVRIVGEYLPLTFSRRHGDPSRPWNLFLIEIRDERGQKKLGYQGNWRDIFQNWEALALSFPGFVESMIFKFLDASTADGHNPYRLTRDGYDWERPDPRSPWASIGYWGDHQIVYLLRLLELSARYRPGRLERLLTSRVFAYANVPYRIRDYDSILADPQHTIDFDVALDGEITAGLVELGEDARALPDGRGGIQHASLAEKLLVTTLARLVDFVPEVGIWMNTQRPEWNDANNALVGHGVSVVTLCQLRRFLAFERELFSHLEGDALEIAAELAKLFGAVTRALEEHEELSERRVSDRERKSLLDALGRAGSEYRSRLYSSGFSGEPAEVDSARLASFFELAHRHLDHAIRANRRDDGLYHAYNVMKISASEIEIEHLPEMLEGQVAVLASGALSAEESLEVLDVLRHSRLYRADQASYLLYPDHPIPSALERNTISEESIERSRLLTELLRRDDRSIVVRDEEGTVHFSASLRNARLLEEALGSLPGDLAPLAKEETPLLLEIYEQIFGHRSFTGRSGSMFKYEGLGCVYWHMVSKLGLAVEELLEHAVEDGEERPVIDRLIARYEEIRGGIGVHKSPALHGAIPIDPYSHTPAFVGAQQPGMTGQVKEDLIARFGELGVRVREGRLGFRPDLLRERELLSMKRSFAYYDAHGQARNLDLAPGELVFTICQVPVVVHAEGPAGIMVTSADGGRKAVEGLDLDAGTSAAIFERSGEVARLDVFYALDDREGRSRGSR
jgi:hypothetical protein